MVSSLHMVINTSINAYQPGIYTTPFPYAHQMGLPQSTSEEDLVKHCLFQLEMLLAQQSAPADTTAIILEPVLGEG